MLEHYFEKPTRLRQLRRGPLRPHIDDLAAELHGAGYAKSSARFILSQAGKFSRFARLAGVERAEQVGEDVVERYLTEELPAEGTFTGAANAMRHMVDHLRRQGVVPPLPPAVAVEDPSAVLLDDYDRYLRDVRGLKASTRKGYRRGGATRPGRVRRALRRPADRKEAPCPARTDPIFRRSGRDRGDPPSPHRDRRPESWHQPQTPALHPRSVTARAACRGSCGP